MATVFPLAVLLITSGRGLGTLQSSDLLDSFEGVLGVECRLCCMYAILCVPRALSCFGLRVRSSRGCGRGPRWPPV